MGSSPQRGTASTRVTARLSRSLARQLDAVVETGAYPNRSAAIRAGIQAIVAAAGDGRDRELDAIATDPPADRAFLFARCTRCRQVVGNLPVHLATVHGEDDAVAVARTMLDADGGER